MPRNLRNLLLVTFPTLIVTALLLEVVFRTVLPASDQPQGFYDASEGIFKFEPGQGTGTHSIGWAARQRTKWRVNNEGWNSPFDYDTLKVRPRVAVIGDSYVEALQVDYDRNFSALMGERLSSTHDVYAFGISSASLSQYLQMSRYVARRFDPDVMIIMVVMNDFDESLTGVRPITYMMTLEVEDGVVTETAPEPDMSLSQYSASKRMLKKSALLRYLIYNLKVRENLRALRSGGGKSEYVDNTKLGRMRRNMARIRPAVDYVIGTLAAENPSRRLIVVMDAPRQRIYEDSSEPYALEPLREMLLSACTTYGVEMIDLERSMTRDFRKNGKRFESPWDHHWNEYGHEIVARTILERYTRY